MKTNRFHKLLAAGALALLSATAYAQTATPCVDPAMLRIDTDGDGSPDCVEVLEGINPNVKDNDVFTDGRLFAQQQYRDFLGRESDEAGTAYWANEVDAPNRTRSEVIGIFLHSAEFEQTIAPIVRLYLAYYMRWPDVAGLQYWIGQRRAGMSLQQMADLFGSSAEFGMRYGSLDNAGFVTLVYNNVLGRLPDVDGLAFWTTQLDEGYMGRTEMMLRFAASPEYVAGTANEVLVAMLYFGMLRREPDAGGFSSWVGYLDAGNNDLALIGAFLDAPEYRNRFF